MFFSWLLGCPRRHYYKLDKILNYSADSVFSDIVLLMVEGEKVKVRACGAFILDGHIKVFPSLLE